MAFCLVKHRDTLTQLWKDVTQIDWHIFYPNYKINIVELKKRSPFWVMHSSAEEPAVIWALYKKSLLYSINTNSQHCPTTVVTDPNQ
jgi:hypothetical protein